MPKGEGVYAFRPEVPAGLYLNTADTTWPTLPTPKPRVITFGGTTSNMKRCGPSADRCSSRATICRDSLNGSPITSASSSIRTFAWASSRSTAFPPAPRRRRTLARRAKHVYQRVRRLRRLGAIAVALASDPRAWLRPGDRMTVEKMGTTFGGAVDLDGSNGRGWKLRGRRCRAEKTWPSNRKRFASACDPATAVR